MSELHISPDLALPLDAVTGTFGILATKGAGKSNAAVVMAEEMSDVGVPWVAIDPKGDWYGVRSSADGKSPGLAVPVLGGRHGDVSIVPTEGAAWADVVLRHRLTCVLDVSQFTKADTTRFLEAFGSYLFRHADDDGAEPLHLFLEEAHEYLPQQVRGDQAQLVGTWQRIVKQGRFKGLGCTLVSQRSSSLNKDVLELVDTLVVLRTIGPRSRDAIKAWVKDQDVDEGLLASLPSLADGEAWVWSPGALRLMERIRFRRRRTFDSGATPKVGEARRAPATLADVDLAAIKEQMAESIEQAKAEDPKELKREVARLRRELAEAKAATPEPEVRVERVEVPVIDEATVGAVQQWTAKLEGLVFVGRRVLELMEAADDRKDVPRAGAASGGAPALANRRGSGRAPQRPDPPARREPRRAPVPRAEAAAVGDRDLSGPERKIVGTLAQFGEGLDRGKLALLCNYHQRAKSFTNALGSLRSKGLVARTEPLALTDAGDVVALDLDVEPLPTGRDLIEFWKSQPKIGGTSGRVLDALYEHGPLSRDELAALLDYHPRAKSFTNAVGQVRGLGLVVGTPDQLELTEELADG